MVHLRGVSLGRSWARGALQLFVVLFPLAFSGPGGASESLDTLNKIRQSGQIGLGFPDKAPQFPFMYLDENKRHIGYSLEIAEKVIDFVRRDQKLPAVDMKWIGVSRHNRTALMNGGLVDLICVSTTNTLERQKSFAFSTSFFVATTRLLTRSHSGVKDFSDLAGKRLLVHAGTTSEQLIRQYDASKKLGVQVVPITDTAASPMAMLQAGHADAYMADDATLYGHLAQSWRPQEWVVTGTPLSREAYGCLMRKDDLAFKALVDEAIAQMMRSGEIRTLYRKWFQSPTPPDGVNLNFPLSEDMESLIRNPNDRAL